MTIKRIVEALQNNCFDASQITDLNYFLVSYQGLTLFQYIAQSNDSIHHFNEAFIRLSILIKEQIPPLNEKKLYAALFYEGLSIFADTVIRQNEPEFIQNLLSDPTRLLSCFNPTLQSPVIILLDGFIPELTLSTLLRKSLAPREGTAKSQASPRNPKKINISMRSCDDYANPHIKAIASQPLSFSPMNRAKGFKGHAPGIAYINNYVTPKPMFTLNVNGIPSVLVTTLLSDLLDYGMHHIRLSACINQPHYALLTYPQSLFIQKQCPQASVHYYLVMNEPGARPFDIVIKSTGIVPGPLACFNHANKKACAQFLVCAFPGLLPDPQGHYSFDSSDINPSVLDLDNPDLEELLNQIQAALSEDQAPAFLWILFHQKMAYVFDLYIYADRFELGFFMRTGCGDLTLAEQYTPLSSQHATNTTHTALSAPRIVAKDTRVPGTLFNAKHHKPKAKLP